MRTKVIFAASIVVSACAIVAGCSSQGSDNTDIDTVVQQYGPAHIDCSKAEPKENSEEGCEKNGGVNFKMLWHAVETGDNLERSPEFFVFYFDRDIFIFVGFDFR